MDSEALNTALYKKMYAEQVAFVQSLKYLPAAEVLNHAYEYTTRENILLSLEYNDLSPKQAEALLKMEYPLQAVFESWENHESSLMGELWNMVEKCADEEIRENKQRDSPAIR